MKRFSIVLGALLLASCNQVAQNPQATPEPTTVGPYEISKADIPVIQEGIRKSLKDPNSAMFGEMKATKRSDGLITVCGYVNAKNSFGGYVGMKPYYGLMTKSPVNHFGIIGMGGTEIETTVVTEFCQKAGIGV